MPRPVAIMDAGKFLHVINESAQSRTVFFAKAVADMGKKEGRDWTLTALGPKQLMFEDQDHDFYSADIVPRLHGRFEINNIKKIQVVESRKSEVFGKTCSDLVDALCEDDTKTADAAFGKLEAFRFRSRVIPESGVVSTRDGVVRHVRVAEGVIPRDMRQAIIESFVSAVKDDVSVDNGRVVRGFFGNAEKFELPIDEMTRRRVVARYMKESAKEAFKSEAFQARVRKWAGMVCEDKLTEAVQDAAKYLPEFQEFCLLSLDETRDLAGNALAANGVFNQKLAEDVGLMIFRTGLKVNRADILESWTQTAKKASDATLLEQVKALSEVKDFEGSYQTLLEHIFTEESDSKTKRGQAYLNSLKIIRSVIGKMEGNEDLVAAMDDAISKFERDKIDDATLYEVEDILASISAELIGEIERMGEFASMPGAPEGGAPPSAPEGEVPGAAVELPPAGEEMPELPEPEPEEKPKKTKKEEPKGEKKEEKKPKAEGEGEESEEPTDEAEGEMSPIESMDEDQLKEELEGWRSKHATFIIEDGVEDCMHQLGRYVKRCNELKAEEVSKGFTAIRELYEDAAAEAIGDAYRLDETAEEDAKIDPNYGTPKPVAEDKDVTDPTKGDYAKDIQMPHGNDGHKDQGGGLGDHKAKDLKPANIGGGGITETKKAVKLEDKDVTDPTKSDYAGDIQMPHGNDGHKDEKGGLGDHVAKDMKPATIGGGGITEAKCECGSGLPFPGAKCPKCGKSKKVAKEDKDITDPTKGDYGKDIQMPHGNDGHKDQGGGLADRKAKDMKPANIGGGGITEGKCPECEGPLALEEVEGVVAACCGGLCDVMYEAKCSQCEAVCEMGRDGKAVCTKCKKTKNEDQFKWGTVRRRYGYRRSAVNPLEKMSAESKQFNNQLDSIIEQIAGEMVNVVEDKDVTDPSKADYSGDVTMPHSNKGHDEQGTPKVGDVLKTGQTAKGSPTLAEAKPGEKVKVEDKDVTDPTKSDYAGDIKMPHGNDGHKEQGGGLGDAKAKDMKPADIGGGTKTAK